MFKGLFAEYETPHIVKILPEIMETIFSRKTFENAQEAADHVKAATELILDILGDVLKAGDADIDLPVSRSPSKFQLADEVEKEIKKRLKILPM